MANSSGFSISALSIRRHIGTLMLTIAVIVLGIFFATTLQVDLLPSITYPRIGVRISGCCIRRGRAADARRYNCRQKKIN